MKDLAEATTFYGQILGLELKKHPMRMVELKLPQGGIVWIYPKDTHSPASFTVLNLVVSDIETAVHEMTQKGVRFEQYPDFNTDPRGIARHPERPPVAWFKDPSANILALMEIP